MWTILECKGPSNSTISLRQLNKKVTNCLCFQSYCAILSLSLSLPPSSVLIINTLCQVLCEYGQSVSYGQGHLFYVLISISSIAHNIVLSSTVQCCLKETKRTLQYLNNENMLLDHKLFREECISLYFSFKSC